MCPMAVCERVAGTVEEMDQVTVNVDIFAFYILSHNLHS